MVTNPIGPENTIYKILLETESTEYTQTKKDNLTRNQRITLANFSKRTDTVINKAVKGSTMVVQGRKQYIKDGLGHLTNISVYKPLDTDITPMIKAEIDCKLESLRLAGMIDKEMKEFCMPPRNHRTSRLYFLKKYYGYQTNSVQLQ